MEELLERMSVALATLEQAAERLRERELSLSAEADQYVERLVATLETQRETELAKQLESAEAKLA